MPEPMPFPYPPEPSEVFGVSMEYSTDIIGAYSTLEQRLSRLTIPRGRISYTVRKMDPAADAGLVALLWSHHANQWAVPLWPYALATTAPLYGGEEAIPCAPPIAGRGLDVIPWLRSLWHSTGILMLWRAPSICQVLQTTGPVVTSGWNRTWDSGWGYAKDAAPPGPATSIPVQGGPAWGALWGDHWGVHVLDEPAFPAGSLVVPCRIGRLVESLADSVDALEVADGRYAWDIEEPA